MEDFWKFVLSIIQKQNDAHDYTSNWSNRTYVGSYYHCETVNQIISDLKTLIHSLVHNCHPEFTDRNNVQYQDIK